MLGAGAARVGQPATKRGSGPEEPDTGVRRTQAGALRVGLHGQSVDVHRRQRLRVLGLESFSQTAHAGADLGVDLGRRLDGVVQLPREGRKGALLAASPPVAVDGRVAQDAVEPRYQRFVRDRREPVGGPDERVLQHVFGEVAPAEPPLQEAQEGAMVLDEDLDRSAAFVDAASSSSDTGPIYAV